MRVTLPSLAALTASGGSDVATEGSFSGDKLRLVASGGSDVVIDVVGRHIGRASVRWIGRALER